MNPYERMVGDVNKLYYKKITTIAPGSVVYDNIWDIQWNNPLAIQRVYQVSKLLGKCPDVLGRKQGQSAVWYNPRSKVNKGNYHKFEIHDHAYQHTKPARHVDFFFVWLRMKMKPDKAADINKITTSAFYYEPGQLVCAACHFIEASIATFSVLKDYNDDKINLEQARQEYDNRIVELLGEFLESEKTVDIEKYPTPLRDIYEEYIMSDMPPEEIFEAPKKSCGCDVAIDVAIVMEIKSTEVDMLHSKLLEPSRLIESESINGLTFDNNLSEADIIRELTMKRIESELNKRGVKPSILSDLSATPVETSNLSATPVETSNLSDLSISSNFNKFDNMVRASEISSLGSTSSGDVSLSGGDNSRYDNFSSVTVNNNNNNLPVNRTMAILPGV